MSKARAWANAQLQNNKLYQGLFLEIRSMTQGMFTRAFLHNEANVSARICQGDNNEVTLLADEALVLARWILDTFGEDAK